MKFTKDVENKYLGFVDNAYILYCSDEEVRQGAASGGAVSAILVYLLEKGHIDGAVVTRVKCGEKGIENETFLAKNREEILSAQTSKYTDTSLVRQCRKLLANDNAKVAVVALPCHTSALRRLMQKDARLADQIKYIITLFCGHSCQNYLLDSVLRRKGICPGEVSEFAFRRGHWRGNMQGKLRNGERFSFPFKDFSYYHNLNFFCLNKCLQCHDHTGYESDFSAGDTWLREMKSDSIKHTIVISRNKRSTQIIKQMMEEGVLAGNETDTATVFRAQRRALIYHYNVTARSIVGKKYGIKIKDTVNARVRWNDWLAAHIIIINHKLSNNENVRDKIFKVPRFIIFIYFLFLKFLQNF